MILFSIIEVAANLIIVSIVFSLIFLILLFFQRWREIKILFLSGFGTYAFTYIIKYLTKIDRPINALIPTGGYAFPSAHSSISFFFATFLSFLILNTGIYIKASTKYLMIGFLYLIAVLIAISRIALKVHTFDQVVIGSAVGILITLIFIKSIK